jgi:D-amino-acid dehydrogenase
MEDGLRLAGTVEFAGMDAPPNMERADRLLEHGRTMFGRLEPQSVRRWMGHRPSLPDGLPAISRSTRHRNVFYAFGHSHFGLMGAPTTGRMVAAMVGGDEDRERFAPFRIDRFRLGRSTASVE